MDCSKMIVIVDDSKTFSMYLGLLLKRMGFEVVPAETGEIGLKMIKVLKPDLVLLDRYMPQMDGPEFLQILRQDPELKDIPVVLVSASEAEDLAAEAAAHGADGFLTKPISPHSLHASLYGALTQSICTMRPRLRYTYNQKVALIHAGEKMLMPAVSLSEGGIYLRHLKPLSVGARVEVILELSGGELRLAGKVIYQKDVFRDSLRIEPGMAIQFDLLDDASRDCLRQYISGLMAGDLVEEQTEEVLTLD